MGHGTVEVRNAAPDRKVASKLEPNPKQRQQKLAAEKLAAEKATQEAASRKASHPTSSSKLKKPKKTPVKKSEPRISTGQFLELGCGYKIAHKVGSGYSTFYNVVAQKGNFEEVVKALEAGKYDLHDPIEANKLLAKMLVPIDQLEEFCRAEGKWKEHANKKTEKLTEKAKEGDTQAKGILKNESRCSEGSWSGNIPEMISTCVGYYNYLMDVEASKKANKSSKGAKAKDKKPVPEPTPNKNVKKFKEAGLVFRRFPLSKNSDKSYVLMFPEKFIHDVKTAILIGRGINEDD